MIHTHTETLCSDIDTNSTISEILEMLYRQHRIPNLARIQHDVLFPHFCYSRLPLDVTLAHIGAGNLSTLHLRTIVHGGMGRSCPEPGKYTLLIKRAVSDS